ncbi:MAG: septum formation protein Maf [Chloroflexi bacterium]|nr:MAG: septum formation protein Maf [Chloroflexota bacterium]
MAPCRPRLCWVCWRRSCSPPCSWHPCSTGTPWPRDRSALARRFAGSAPSFPSPAALPRPWCSGCCGSEPVTITPTLVLASSSARRVDILKLAGVRFRTMIPGIDERPPRPLGPVRFVLWAAEAKAEAVASRVQGAVVVAADTEVVLDRRIFGKPTDRRQAADFLRALSGRTHLVYTAVQIIDGSSGCRAQGISRTYVTMRELSDAAISAYVRSGEAQDKAGAYAIQGEGRRLVTSIRGPYDNVVGMPMRLLTRLLGECGIPLLVKNPDGPELTPLASD